MSLFAAELIGTMILIILGVGVVAGVVLKDSKAEGSDWIVITIGWGLGVTMGIYAVGEISGAHLNPAVTLGFAVVGDFPWSEVPKYIIAQIIGAILGAIIVFYGYIAHFYKTDDPTTKLAVFATIPAIKNPLANLITEIIGTFILVLGLLFIGTNEFTEGLNPIVVGVLILAIGLSLGGPTGYAINPARDLGPRIAHFILPIPNKGKSNWSYSWVPIIGPIFGAILAALFYKQFYLKINSIGFWLLLALTFGLFSLTRLKLAKQKNVMNVPQEET